LSKRTASVASVGKNIAAIAKGPEKRLLTSFCLPTDWDRTKKAAQTGSSDLNIKEGVSSGPAERRHLGGGGGGGGGCIAPHAS